MVNYVANCDWLGDSLGHREHTYIIYGFQVLYCIAGFKTKFSNPCHALKNSVAMKGLNSIRVIYSKVIIDRKKKIKVHKVYIKDFTTVLALITIIVILSNDKLVWHSRLCALCQIQGSGYARLVASITANLCFIFISITYQLIYP